MGTITLKNLRTTADVKMNATLKDGGVFVDWASLSDIKAWLWSDTQRALAGRCDVRVDATDSTKLICEYASTKPQYPGVNRLIVQASYMGATKTYDKPAFNFVRWTGDQAGQQVTIDDPEVNVDMEVTDVTSSILQEAIAAALAAAAHAEHAASLVPLQVLQDCEAATAVALTAAAHAPQIGENGNWWIWSSEQNAYVDTGKVARGATGNGIASFTVVESQEDDADNVVTVTFTDGQTETFTVKNGKTGNGIASIVQTVESPDDAGTNVITITMTNGTVVTFNVKNGSKGQPGAAQAAYKSVAELPTASAETMDKIYLTPSGTSGIYNMSYTDYDGSAYSWVSLGTTAIQLSDYVPKTDYDIFKAPTSVDFTDDVLELYIIKTPNENAKFQSYSGNAYIICSGSTIYAKTQQTGALKNNDVYPLTTFNSTSEEFPLGTIIGYVIFRDVASFVSKTSSSNMQNINLERCKNLSKSPLINSAVGIVDAKSKIAAKATNATNVVDAAIEHSSFVKELYLFGTGVDKSKRYVIQSVARNHSNDKWSIVIMAGDTIVSYLLRAPAEPDNPVLIPQYNSSGVNAYAIVNWDEFALETNNQKLGITLSERVFDLRYSPTIDNAIKIGPLQDSVSALQEAGAELQGDMEYLQDEVSGLDELAYDKSEYGRSDFYAGYLATQSAAIGNTVSLPSDNSKVTPDSVAGHLNIQLKKGEKVTAYYKAYSNKYLRAWVFLSSDRKIVSWSDPQTNDGTAKTYDFRVDPLIFRAEQDGYLIIQFPKSEYADNENLHVVHQYHKKDFVKVCAPNTIFAVVGDTLQLYYRSIFRCVDYSRYAVKVVCGIGAQYPRYYEVTPLAGNVGTHTLEFTLKDNNNVTLGRKTVNLVVVAAGTSPSSELNVLCLGASATSGGQWASELKRRLVGSGGTPAGSGLSNIMFVGRKDVTHNGTQVKLEATGGYSFPSYTSTATARYRFNVTAENEPTINVGDVYSNNGNNYTVKEINISAGSGGYFSCEGTGAPQSSGVLTKVSGTGSETIIYDSTSFSGNPFAYDGAINMQQYADDFCNPQNAAHGRIDVVYTELFGNGTSPYTEDFTTRLSQMQALITQVRAVFPNCKFCIGLFWNPDLRGGMGRNYGASGTWSDPYGIKYSNMNLCNALQKYITDNNLGEYVFITNWLNEFDEENDMQQTTKKVNVRSTVTEIFGVNGVHPSNVGYYQMADTAWRLFIAKFCQGS